jgi:hypothetical protein
MKFIPEDKKKEILEKGSLDNLLNQYHTFKASGSSLLDDCPVCNGKKKFSYSKAKQTAACFKCDIKVSSPVNYLQKFQNKTFPEALEEVARLEGVSLEDEKKPTVIAKEKKVVKKAVANPTKKRSKTTDTYCDRMLAESGLTLQDIISDVQVDEDTIAQRPSYSTGSVDARFKIIPGDDVIIRYFDLENKPMTYYRLGKNKQPTDKKEEFYRVRFQNPELHKDKNGKPSKYKSPYGSGSKVYLPQVIRTKYQHQSKIKTLYIQEGEKKADKACKHKMFSVGVMGIHNIAYGKSLPREFEQIIRVCQVENVVFVLDADFQDLSSNITANVDASARSYSFFRAVLTFKDYFYAFTNNDIFLNIFFGHVKENQKKDKGVDDLLTNSLKGIENELAVKCEAALIDPSGNADFLQFHKITTISEAKLKAFWSIESKEAFINKHKIILKALPVFKVGKTKWRFNEKGIVEMAQPIEDHEKYWEYKEKQSDDGGKTITGIKFKYHRCYKFLKNRGFGRLMLPGNNYMFILQENTIVKEVNRTYIKDYITEFTKDLGELKYEPVLDMLYSGGSRYLGEDSLSNLEYNQPEFHESSRGIQYLYFNEFYWKITKEGIEENALQNLPGHVWKDKIRDFLPKKTDNLFKEIHRIDSADVQENEELKPFMGEWTLDFSETGENCDFLQFLLNTSSFYHHNHTKDLSDYSLAEKFETTRHLLSKLTTIGFMLHNYRDPGLLKAVICMDGKMSEVGNSNGRSGKSLIGEYLRWLIPTVYIGGKKKDLTDDSFIWEEVDERTEMVFIDDVRANFDFERFFPEITGDFQINAKGIKKYTLPRAKSPKLLVTTNHAVKGQGASFKDRQVLIGFSDWYSETYKPKDDFDTMFFEDWGHDQSNLAYNLAATCLSLYFKYGLISAPTEKLERRKLRQEIGEDFMTWADGIFADFDNINENISKISLYKGVDHPKSKRNVKGNSYLVECVNQKRYATISKFKNQMKFYCKFKGWEFNPKTNGNDIKTNGVEYFHISLPENETEKLRNERNKDF